MLLRARVWALVMGVAVAVACSEREEPEEPARPVDPTAFLLGPSFAPDPMVRTGMAGGPNQASQRNAECRGYISALPSHRLELAAPMPYLRIAVHAGGDPTLVVALADGTYRCNDDFEGLNSLVEGAFPAGAHQIFVGTYGEGPPMAYTIGVSRGTTMTPSTLGGAAPPPPVPPTPPPPPVPPTPPPGVASGRQPTLRLTPGFRPDPQIQTSWAGGTMPVGVMGNGCVGAFPLEAQHLVVVPQSLPTVRFVVSSELDTTLAIRGSNGSMYCNDDMDGLNPGVEANLEPGSYEVFVGTYGQGQGGPYRIAVTTNEDLTAAMVASSEAPPPYVGPSPTPPLPTPPGPDVAGGRVVPGMLPGDMSPEGLTPAQRASADAHGISYYEARELYRCHACMRNHDYDHCIMECREPCLECVGHGPLDEARCGPPCGGRRR